MNTAALLPGQFVKIARGRYAGQHGTIRLVFAHSVEVYVNQDGRSVLATVLGSSLDAANVRKAVRATACEKAGVTWAWLTETLTTAEADAWLMLDPA